MPELTDPFAIGAIVALPSADNETKVLRHACVCVLQTGGARRSRALLPQAAALHARVVKLLAQSCQGRAALAGIEKQAIALEDEVSFMETEDNVETQRRMGAGRVDKAQVPVHSPFLCVCVYAPILIPPVPCRRSWRSWSSSLHKTRRTARCCCSCRSGTRGSD